MVMDEELEAAFLKEQERRLAASTIAGYGRNLNFVRRSYQGEWPGWVHLSTAQIRAFFVRRQIPWSGSNLTRSVVPGATCPTTNC